MLIAWGLGDYPLLGGHSCCAPIYVLLAAEGVVSLTRKARHHGLRTAIVVSAGIVGAALAAPAVAHTVRPRAFHEMKPVLEYIAHEELAGDSVYVYYTAQPQLRYYLECGCAGSQFEAAQDAGLWPLRPGRGGQGQLAPALGRLRRGSSLRKIEAPTRRPTFRISIHSAVASAYGCSCQRSSSQREQPSYGNSIDAAGGVRRWVSATSGTLRARSSSISTT
jgi:hypothetical protein